MSVFSIKAEINRLIKIPWLQSKTIFNSKQNNKNLTLKQKHFSFNNIGDN